jgi:beta-xylosidase
MMSHGYEHGFWTLGRQCLLQPVRWSRDGWPVAEGGDLSSPIPKPLQLRNQIHGFALSDAFSANRLGTHWSFYAPSQSEAARFQLDGEGLRLAAKGVSPADSSPLCFIAGDHSYEVTADLEIEPGCQAGLLVFYSQRLYAGLGFDRNGLVLQRYGRERRAGSPSSFSGRLHIRLQNDRDTVTIHTSPDGEEWTKFGVQMDVSGYHHNTMGDFLSLRPAIYAAGAGGVRVRSVHYRAL